jgi:hypothetical protein
MSCSRVAAGLWYACVLPWAFEKNHNKKKISNQLNIKKLRLSQSIVFSRKKLQN